MIGVAAKALGRLGRRLQDGLSSRPAPLPDKLSCRARSGIHGRMLRLMPAHARHDFISCAHDALHLSPLCRRRRAVDRHAGADHADVHDQLHEPWAAPCHDVGGRRASPRSWHVCCCPRWAWAPCWPLQTPRSRSPRSLGAAYLIWLGISTFRSDSRPERIAQPPPRPRRSFYLQGVLVGASNPKAVLFFAAFFPAVHRSRHADRAAVRHPGARPSWRWSSSMLTSCALGVGRMLPLLRSSTPGALDQSRLRRPVHADGRPAAFHPPAA